MDVSRWWSTQKLCNRFTPATCPAWLRSQHDTCNTSHVTVFVIRFHREMHSPFCSCQQAIIPPPPSIKIVGADFFWQLASPVLIYFIPEKCLCLLLAANANQHGCLYITQSLKEDSSFQCHLPSLLDQWKMLASTANIHHTAAIWYLRCFVPWLSATASTSNPQVLPKVWPRGSFLTLQLPTVLSPRGVDRTTALLFVTSNQNNSEVGVEIDNMPGLGWGRVGVSPLPL